MSEQIVKTKEFENGTYKFKKFNAMQGVKIARLLASKVLQGLDGNGVVSLFQNLKQNGGNTDSSNIFETIDVELVLNSLSGILENLSDEELENLSLRCLVKVSKELPAGDVPIMDANGNYLVQDIEYNPQLFISLIFEQLKWGLSDFLDGNRWKSLIPDNLASLTS